MKLYCLLFSFLYLFAWQEWYQFLLVSPIQSFVCEAELFFHFTRLLCIVSVLVATCSSWIAQEKTTHRDRVSMFIEGKKPHLVIDSSCGIHIVDGCENNAQLLHSTTWCILHNYELNYIFALVSAYFCPKKMHPKINKGSEMEEFGSKWVYIRCYGARERKEMSNNQCFFVSFNSL